MTAASCITFADQASSTERHPRKEDTYTITSVNTSDTYQWAVAPNLTPFTLRN